MKIITLAAMLALAGTAAAADPVLGTWRTQPDDAGNFGLVELAPCAGKVCGTLVRTYGPSGAPIESLSAGRQIVQGMSPNGGGAYSGGTIYAPDRDKTYRSKMALAGDRLEVSGCVGPFCRSQVWSRVD